MIQTAVLMCHAPITIPAIGGVRAEACANTTVAMRRTAEHLARSAPDVLVVVSPHAPRNRVHFSVAHADQLYFDFSRFGNPALHMHFPGAPAAADALLDVLSRAALGCASLKVDRTDHGAAVPLYFVQEAGFRGPVLLLSLPYPGTETEQRFGKALAHTSDTLNQRWAILASGDMSHRLIEGAPAGYHPHAHVFDETFVDHVKHGRLHAATSIDPALTELAAEDVVASMAVAVGATTGDPRGCTLLAYEGPFGVGYTEAILFDRAAPPTELVAIARQAIFAMLMGAKFEPPPLEPPWDEPRAVFVTLREADGRLRGCVGRLVPEAESLAREVANTARSSARSDPRFDAVTLTELPSLSIEVSVLESPEPVADESALNPRVYGVVVASGHRHGVLLPNVPGIETVAEQVRIAKHKAGVPPGHPVQLQRFRVHKVIDPRVQGPIHLDAGADG